MLKRAYDNSTRERQRQETRDTILSVMVKAMAQGGDDVPVSEIARQAGVATRTVYVHLPDRESRVDGINAWIDGQVDMSRALPTSYDDLRDYGARLVDYVLDNEMIIRAQMAPGLSRDVRTLRKQPHIRSVTEILMDAGWPGRDAKRVAMMMIATIRAEATSDLRDTYGYSVNQIRQMMSSLTANLMTSEEARLKW